MVIAVDDSVFKMFDNGDFETTRSNLIKQSKNFQRFGNKAFREHPQRDSITSAINFLQPDQLNEILGKTVVALQGKASQRDISQDIHMPHLAKELFISSPLYQIELSENKQSASLTTSSRMILLLSEVNKLTNDVALQKMVGQLRNYNAQQAGYSKMYSSLADELELAVTLWANDRDVLSEVQKQVEGLKLQVEVATSTHINAQQVLLSLQTQSEQALQENGYISPELSKEIEDAKSLVRETYSKKEQVVAQYDNVLDRKLKPAVQAEMASNAFLENRKQHAEKLLSALSGQQVSIIESRRAEKNKDAKGLNYLLAVIAQLINESASNDLQAGAALKQKMAEAAAKEAEDKAKKFEVDQQKAEEMQKTLGCMGKILGWAITIFSVAAAIFTGGASLALAAIGLALALGDEIYQAVTGESFIEQAMRPLMDGVIKPLINAVAKVISEVLQSFGVDKEKADTIGNIVGAIVVIVALVALAVVASSFLGSLVSKIGQKLATTSIMQASREMLKKMMNKIMDNAIAQIFRRLGTTIVSKFGTGRAAGEMAVNITKRAANVAIGVNALTHTSLNITASAYQYKADKLRAKIIENLALQEILNELMDRMVDSFINRLSGVNAIVDKISQTTESQMQTGRYITHNIRNIAC